MTYNLESVLKNNLKYKFKIKSTRKSEWFFCYIKYKI